MSWRWRVYIYTYCLLCLEQFFLYRSRVKMKHATRAINHVYYHLCTQKVSSTPNHVKGYWRWSLEKNGVGPSFKRMIYTTERILLPFPQCHWQWVTANLEFSKRRTLPIANPTPQAAVIVDYQLTWGYTGFIILYVTLNRWGTRDELITMYRTF